MSCPPSPKTILVSVCAGTLWLASLVSAQQNVLLVVADDLGVDLVAAYGEHPEPGNTPVIDSLAADGMLFRNAWSNPLCSPSRAQLLTGRPSFQTGVGWAIGGPPFTGELPGDETTLAEALGGTHTSWAVGKWHLSSDAAPLMHPLQQGFDSHRGPPSNLLSPGESYDVFTKTVDGVESTVSTYVTTDSVDDAIALIQGQPPGQPWFMWLAFNAPHAPYHKPPGALHSFALPPDVAGNEALHVKAAVEALDTELGRLLSSIDPAVRDDTLVVFVGDNGSDALATTAPFDPTKAKGTLYEGGVNVPLILSGPGVPTAAECQALVSLTDVFATVLDVLGVPLPAGTDSTSLVPYFTQPALPSLRSWLYAEQFHGNGLGPYARWDQAIRDEHYKLLRFHTGSLLPARKEFYDLLADPLEQNDLLAGGTLTQEQRDALAALSETLGGFLGPWRELGQDLPGTNGAPSLTGSGALQGGDAMSLTLDDALPLANAALVVGFSELGAPFHGGVFVPSPDVIIAGLVTSAAGALPIAATWPLDVPASFTLYLQYWVQDPGGVWGFSASNAIAAITP